MENILSRKIKITGDNTNFLLFFLINYFLKHWHPKLQDLRKQIENYFENLFLSANEFSLILVGKDGGINLNSRNTSLKEIFYLIDTIPIRQEEMLNDKC